ncbi:uncharacterized protein MONOS_11478 [Monocercomonoides exilis]|uniref:uncharacterized protein n=1 Tax=Monocercomonoides exilis TaxID=2049356 RepID=UPI0035594BF0|nr:hypothetical protein MONOS_11478 [Monocercomonoides exilis]|eukprot:MONOS_11478.1-p1 / transcript=MONOS_11478.1 / gene=MONOS_11478 / organism=Monocercomonoides_exilis_PA203 / gene_product=unspecified product / transcript_product=unspecified product / location=Mono_scaffold00579:1821-2321(+) / protein_length=139 / sequence_SO=supercontig / SO=protein_coding / is_pseudo=false
MIQPSGLCEKSQEKITSNFEYDSAAMLEPDTSRKEVVVKVWSGVSVVGEAKSCGGESFNVEKEEDANQSVLFKEVIEKQWMALAQKKQQQKKMKASYGETVERLVGQVKGRRNRGESGWRGNFSDGVDSDGAADERSV